jgi:pimeloyl-ACP methyl ester carboxylesterase/class 3 adenylate cyclase
LAVKSATRETISVQPQTGYAKSGDVNIAYQVVGEGAFDLVYVPGALSNVDLIWEDEARSSFFSRLASFARVIVFDKRGTGASDHVEVGDLETRMDDVRAVMDAAGSSRAGLVGVSEGGPMSVLFAATFPERVAALVLYGALPRFAWAPDFPWGQRLDDWQRELDDSLRMWGTVEQAREITPDASEPELEAAARRRRLSGSPGAYRKIEMMNMTIDVRHVLPSIVMPTLVLHRREDDLPIDGAHWMAEQIRGAEFVTLPSGPHFPYLGDWRPLVDEIERFILDVREHGEWDAPEPERTLATVLFTDIVAASEHAAKLGDHAWRDLLEYHHALIRRQLVRFRGHEVDTAGDGFFASFDGPARAIRCARAIVDSIPQLGLDIRAGLHTGECELIDGKVAGIAVHTGARVASNAQPGEVLVSSTVKDLVAGSGIAFHDRGLHKLKGIPGKWQLYAVDRNG